MVHVHRDAHRREEGELATDALADAVALEPVLHRTLELGEGELDTARAELDVELFERLGRRRIDVGDRLRRDDHPLHRQRRRVDGVHDARS